MQLLNLKKKANTILRVLGKGGVSQCLAPVFIIFNCETIFYFLVDPSFIYYQTSIKTVLMETFLNNGIGKTDVGFV